MKYALFLCLLFCYLPDINAQDQYHSDLLSFLQNDYNLPTGEWLFFDNETAILNDAISYGAATSIEPISGEPFSSMIRLNISQTGGAPWDAGWNIRNNTLVQAGDKLLLVFYVRSIGGAGNVNVFVENGATFNKEIYLSLPLTEEWQRYLIPIESSATYNANNLSCGFHLATQAQTIELGGFTALNFKKAIQLEDLPNETNNERYDGSAADAPWRAEAASRINQLRKANLSITAQDTNGDPVEAAAVQVNMLRHEFEFGTAITASRLAGNNAHNVIYENKIVDLDGQGHGFNAVVFENDLKWPAWEDEWFVNKTELVDAVKWLRDRELSIRGHTLVWPGLSNLPSDIQSNINDLTYIKNRINGHLETVLNFPGVAGQIDEWDVLNEIITNTSLENVFRGSPGYPTGRELYVEIFNKAREIDPNIGLWLNDFITISLNQSAGTAQYDRYKMFIQELVDAGVDLEGIGFQAHVGGFPNGIPSVLNTLDDFYNSFGLKAKITEFDLPSFVSEELAANYLRDFLTAIFSHPSVDGFLFWSFWDGATYMNEGSNLFRLDWSETPAKDTFVNLLFNEWWTKDELTTSNLGMADTRVFKGRYEIIYTCDGVLQRDTIMITENMNHSITCDQLTTSTTALNAGKIKVFPNPSQGNIHIERATDSAAQVRIFDVQGRLIYQSQIQAALTKLQPAIPKGLYFLEITSEKEHYNTKIIFE